MSRPGGPSGRSARLAGWLGIALAGALGSIPLSHAAERAASAWGSAPVAAWAAIAAALCVVASVRWLGPAAAGAQADGAAAIVVDTSALVDGRLPALLKTGVLPGRVLVPEAVARELQTLADSRASGKRARGRRALDQLAELRRTGALDVEPPSQAPDDGAAADARLVARCAALGARLLTTDEPLARLCEAHGVTAIQLHDLARALAPRLAPGERATLTLTRAGESEGQAVGHLPDGSMVVVEGARDRVGDEVLVEIVSMRRTRSGPLYFARGIDPADSPETWTGPPRYKEMILRGEMARELRAPAQRPGAHRR